MFPFHHQVKGLMMYEGRKSSLFDSILMAAATSGNKDTWEAVLAELERSEVEVTPPGRGNTGGPSEGSIPSISSL